TPCSAVFQTFFTGTVAQSLLFSWRAPFQLAFPLKCQMKNQTWTASLLRTLARYFPSLLRWRIHLIVAWRWISYPLRFLPVSSKYFGPPKGEYKNLRHFSRDPASRGLLTFIQLSKWRIGRRKLP